MERSDRVQGDVAEEDQVLPIHNHAKFVRLPSKDGEFRTQLMAGPRGFEPRIPGFPR